MTNVPEVSSDGVCSTIGTTNVKPKSPVKTSDSNINSPSKSCSVSPSSTVGNTTTSSNQSTDCPSSPNKDNKKSPCKDKSNAEKKDDTPPVPGSIECPYRLAIVGGGPAGTSIIVRAIHLGVINELCSFGAHRDPSGELKKKAGVCMFDASCPERFGGGRLQDYVINSNTFGGKFVTNIVQDRPNVIPPEKASGTILETLESTAMAQALGKYGSDIAPLSDIGVFLVEIGNQVRKQLDHYRESSKYESRTEVTQLQQSECRQFWKITSINLKSQMMTETYAYQVVLATGGAQKLPRLSPASRNNKLMTSDDVCTNAGVATLKAKLEKKDKKKIVIIGGSHSAFSAAWICLNRLTLFSNEFQIYILHRTSVKVFYATKKEAEKDKYYDYDAPNKCGQIHPFAGLRGDAKSLYRSIKSGQETRIRLLCTGPDGSNHQTMANKLMEEAHVIVWACGYAANTQFKVLDHLGNNIKLKLDRGQVSVNDLAMVMRDTSAMPVKPTVNASQLAPDAAVTTPLTAIATALSKNTPIPCVEPTSTTAATISSPVLRRTPSTASMDQCSEPIHNLLGTGLGFGLSLGNNSTETAKADGVAVYLKRGATLILSHVVGTKVFGENALTWEQHVAVNLKRSAMIALELQIQEKQQKDQERAARQGLTVDSSDMKGYLSPKKNSRKSMMFDPSSPSNSSSTGIGAGIGIAVKRSVSTAPTGSSRPRTYNKSSSVGSNSSVACSSGSVVNNSPTKTNPPTNTTSKHRSIRSAIRNERPVEANTKTKSPVERSMSNTETKKRSPGEASVTSNDETKSKDSENVVDEFAGGVSVLTALSDDDDPPPTYRSQDSAEKPPSTTLAPPSSSMFPQVPGVSSNDSEGATDQAVSKTATMTTDAQVQQEATLSRLCQPKMFTRSPIKTKSSADVPPHVVVKTAKAPSEFCFDLPPTVVRDSSNPKETLTHIGSDNLHFDMLQPTDTENSLLTEEAEGCTSAPSPSTSSHSTSVTMEVEVEDCGTGGNGADSARRQLSAREQRQANNSNGKSRSRPGSSTTRPRGKSGSHSNHPPSSPITKPKKDQNKTKPNVKENNKIALNLSSGNGNMSNGVDSNASGGGGGVSGPTVADLLWAEKRTNQLQCKTPPRQPQPQPHPPSTTSNSTPSKPTLSTSPIVLRQSTNGSRAQSSGGARSGRAAKGHHSVTNYVTSSRRDGKRGLGSAGTRSPVPSSAPQRSKRIMSQSLNGPPTSMLKLPQLQEPVTKASMFKKIMKPTLFVKHDVFAKPPQTTSEVVRETSYVADSWFSSFNLNFDA